MRTQVISKLNKLPFYQVYMKPLTYLRRDSEQKQIAVVGFDTEYDSHTQKLISYQFSYKGSTIFNEMKESMTIEELEFYVRQAYSIHTDNHLILVSYWSNAEIFNISNWIDCKLIAVSPSGIHHLVTATCTIFDIAHFNAPIMPLAKMAESYGLKKLEWDRKNVTRRDAKSKKFREYAVNDAYLCERLFLLLYDAFLKLGANIFEHPTPASAAMTAFRKLYLQSDIRVRKRVRKMALRCNWGARVELFQKEMKGELIEYDADSLYPNAAISLGGLPSYLDWRSGTPTKRATGGFGKVSFTFPSHTMYPCLPVWREGIGLLFPLSGRSYCTLAEIRVAESMGASIEYRCFYYYEHASCPELGRFLEDMKHVKDNATASNNASLRNAAKLMNNSIIGKFNQHKAGFNINKAKELADAVHIPLSVWLRDDYISAEKQEFMNIEQYKIGSAFHPEWSTLILGKARAIMAEALLECDAATISTDSVIIPKKQQFHASVPFKIDKTFTDFVAVRPRVYVLLDGDTPVKVAHHAIHTSMMEAAEIILQRQTSYSRSRLPNFRDAALGRPPLSPITSTMRFNHASDLKRRWVGNQSYPWTSLDEIEIFTQKTLDKANGLV